MAPKDYMTIRNALGRGSGQESPGFKRMLQLPDEIWPSFAALLAKREVTLRQIYEEPDKHPELFTGVRHAIGESGGVALHLGGRRFYPIMVSEKRGCQMVVTLRGSGGHGSVPARGGAMARLGELLIRLDGSRLPVHITTPVRLQVEAMRDALDEPLKSRIGALLDPARTDAALEELAPLNRGFEASLHNTVNATIVSGGLKINVIPSEVRVQLDGRLLPGFGPEDMVRELRAVVGPEPEIEVTLAGPAQPEVDLSQFDLHLTSILRSLTTLAQSWLSAFIAAANCAGELPIGASPCA